MKGAWRQEWAQAIRSATDLSMTARMVGQVLALDFANEQTGQCNPSRQTLASHLGVSEATVKRALAELTSCGWLARTAKTARNRTASYTFQSPGKVVAFDAVSTRNAGHARPATGDRTRVKSAPNAGQICTPPYKGRNQVMNQGARDGQRCPVERIEVAHYDGHRAVAWDEWLTRNGWPSLSELSQKASDGKGAGWRVPTPMPPKDRESIQWRIAEKYCAWAAARLEDRRQGVA